MAVGEKRVRRDRRERRRGGRALRLALGCGLDGGHEATQGSCQRPWPETSFAAAFGPQLPGRVAVDRGRRVEQRLHHPPGLLDAVLAREALAVADHRRVQEHLVRCGALTAFLGELHVELDRLRIGAFWRGARRRSSLTPVEGSSLTTSWFASGRWLVVPEAEARRMLEDEP